MILLPHVLSCLLDVLDDAGCNRLQRHRGARRAVVVVLSRAQGPDLLLQQAYFLSLLLELVGVLLLLLVENLGQFLRLMEVLFLVLFDSIIPFGKFGFTRFPAFPL